jgi:hypothetical protein
MMTPRLKRILYYLSHPWLILYLFEWYNSGWDKELNTLLDTNPTVSDGFKTAKVGNYELWLCNWPYSFGNHYQHHDKQASRLTKQRLRDYVKASGAKIRGLDWL